MKAKTEHHRGFSHEYWFLLSAYGGLILTTSFQTNPVSLKDLMRACHEGKLQLPDFQRGWVWDQDRIIDLLASISEGFPVGALMTLDASGAITRELYKRMTRELVAKHSEIVGDNRVNFGFGPIFSPELS